MRLRTLILVAIVSIVSACAEKPFEVGQPQETGTLSIQIEPEIRVDNATKAVSGSPDVNEFKVEIYKYANQGLLRLYRDSYENTVGKQISLNAADYMVHARHGDSLGVGFNAIYYAAQANLTVHPQTNEVVRLEAKMANAKVAVVYGDDLKYDWPEYYAKVKCTTKGGRKRSLQFSQTEKRAGYMPSGEFVVELYINIQGEWKYYHSDPMTVAPNDFITFKVDTERASGDFSLSARVNRDGEILEKDYALSSEWLPKDAPTIMMLDADGNNFGGTGFSIVEAENAVRNDLQADINAPGRIKECWLEVTSEYLNKLGVPERVDLAADMDPSVEQTLKSVGLKWMKGMSGQRLGYVDFSGITKWLDQLEYNASEPFNSVFTLNVIDSRQAVGEVTSDAVSFTHGAPEFILNNVHDYDCWAWQIKNITAQMIKGNPDKLVLEYKKSTDGDSAWTALQTSSASGSVSKHYELLNTTPATTYNFRLSYNGNPATAVYMNATTEAPAQVGNNGFEEHTYESFAFKYKTYIIGNATTTAYRTWYQPFKSGEIDPWWAVNSTTTLDANVTREYLYYKCFPTVNMTCDNVYSGNRSILIASVAVADAASDWDLAGAAGDCESGELYIGKADNSGEHKNAHISDGHAFSSRPKSMSFYHRFDCHDSPFKAEIILYNGSTVIASGSYTSEAVDVADWTRVDVPLTYTVTNLAATKIYISFISSSTNSTEWRTIKFNVLDTNGKSKTTDNVHAGNIVWFDDVILNYE